MIGKRGASGGYCMSFVDEGLGCAIKIDDGSDAQYVIAMKCLHWSGMNCFKQGDALSEDEEEKFLSWNNLPNKDYQNVTVGSMKVSSSIFNGSYDKKDVIG